MLKGEHPADTARREVEEETGYRPVGEPEHLVSFEPLPGLVTADTDVYLWRKVEKVGEPTDTEEVGRLEWVPLSRVLEFVKRREVLGAGALVRCSTTSPHAALVLPVGSRQRRAISRANIS
jgi:ADP-ribose pyrophosphatase